MASQALRKAAPGAALYETRTERELHANIDKVFHWAVTEAGRTQFGYELVTETGGDS